MSRPRYKELWLDEHKDRDEQLQWIRNAVNGNAKFHNSEPPYSEEEELARKIMQMHARIAELKELLDTESQLSNQFYLLLVDNPKSKKLADDLIEALRINGKEVQE